MRLKFQWLAIAVSLFITCLASGQTPPYTWLRSCVQSAHYWIDFSPDGSRLACSNFGNSIQILRTGDGFWDKTISTGSGTVRGLVYSTDGTHVFALLRTTNVIASYRVSDGALDATISLAGSPVDFAVSSDQSRFFVAYSQTVDQIDATTGLVLATATSDNGTIADISLSPDGQWVGAATSLGSVIFRTSDMGIQSEFANVVYFTSIDFIPGTSTYVGVYTDGLVYCRDIATSNPVWKSANLGGSVYQIAASPNGQYLAAVRSNGLRFLDPSTGQLLFTQTGYAGNIQRCKFKSDSSRVAIASGGGYTWLATVEASPTIRSVSGSLLSAGPIAPDGNGLFGLSGLADTVNGLYDTSTGLLLDSYASLGVTTQGAGFSPDGQYVAIKDIEGGGTVKIFKRNDHTLIATIPGSYNPDFSPDGQFLACWSGGGAIYLYRTSDWQLDKSLLAGGTFTFDLVFSPDSSRVFEAVDKRLVVFDVQTGAKLKDYQPLTNARVLKIAFVPSGTQFFLVVEDNVFSLWDSTTFTKVRDFVGHTDFARSVAVSTDGRYVLSTSFDGQDGSVRVWRVSDAQFLTMYNTETALAIRILHDPVHDRFFLVGNGQAGMFENAWANLSFPDSFRIARGVLVGGNQASLMQLDEDRLRVRPGLVFNVSEAPVNVEFDSSLPVQSPASLVVHAVCRVTSPNIKVTMQLYDWQANAWDVGTGETFNGSFVDSEHTLTVAPAGRFVQPGTKLVRSRLFAKANGIVTTLVWRLETNKSWVSFE